MYRPPSILSLLAFLAKIMGTPNSSAQMVASAIPLASTVSTAVMPVKSKSRPNSFAISRISLTSTRWFKNPSTLIMLPGRTLPSFLMRS